MLNRIVRRGTLRGMVRLVTLLGLYGCGRLDFAPTADGAAALTACEAAWIAGPTLTAPVAMTAVNSAKEERTPTISSDGLTLYFASNRTGDYQLYAATRAAPDASFAAPTELSALSSPQLDHQVHVSDDELEAVVSSARLGGRGSSDLWHATRASPGVPFGPLVELSELDFSGEDYNAVLSPDRRRIYFATLDRPGTAGATDVMTAQRATPAEPFGTPEVVAGIVTLEDEASPSLTHSQRVMVFTAVRGGQAKVWYATRADAESPWGTPMQVPGIASTKVDYTPFVRADGCELVFSSLRVGNIEDLYVSRVEP